MVILWSFGIGEIFLNKRNTFLVGAFLEKRIDYSLEFSSVFFPDKPEVTKTVLPKVLQTFKVLQNSTRWPRELNQKGFSLFPHNIQYRARLKGPLFLVGEFSFQGKMPDYSSDLFSRRFLRKSRLLQWLVFFVSSMRSVHFLCIMHFYHMYLVLHFQHIQCL